MLNIIYRLLNKIKWQDIGRLLAVSWHTFSKRACYYGSMQYSSNNITTGDVAHAASSFLLHLLF